MIHHACLIYVIVMHFNYSINARVREAHHSISSVCALKKKDVSHFSYGIVFVFILYSPNFSKLHEIEMEYGVLACPVVI